MEGERQEQRWRKKEKDFGLELLGERAINDCEIFPLEWFLFSQSNGGYQRKFMIPILQHAECSCGAKMISEKFNDVN